MDGMRARVSAALLFVLSHRRLLLVDLAHLGHVLLQVLCRKPFRLRDIEHVKLQQEGPHVVPRERLPAQLDAQDCAPDASVTVRPEWGRGKAWPGRAVRAGLWLTHHHPDDEFHAVNALPVFVETHDLLAVGRAEDQLSALQLRFPDAPQGVDVRHQCCQPRDRDDDVQAREKPRLGPA
jgi:hypothetical protein